jgi:hypothetical protein
MERIYKQKENERAAQKSLKELAADFKAKVEKMQSSNVSGTPKGGVDLKNLLTPNSATRKIKPGSGFFS